MAWVEVDKCDVCDVCGNDKEQVYKEKWIPGKGYMYFCQECIDNDEPHEIYLAIKYNQ